MLEEIELKQKKFQAIKHRCIQLYKNLGANPEDFMDKINNYAEYHSEDYTIEEQKELIDAYVERRHRIEKDRLTEKQQLRILYNLDEKEEARKKAELNKPKHSASFYSKFRKNILNCTTDLGYDYGQYLQKFLDTVLRMYYNEEFEGHKEQISWIKSNYNKFLETNEEDFLCQAGFSQEQIDYIKNALRKESVLNGKSDKFSDIVEFSQQLSEDVFENPEKIDNHHFNLDEYIAKQGMVHSTELFKQIEKHDYVNAFNNPQFFEWASQKNKKSYIKGLWTKMNNRYHKANDMILKKDQEKSKDCYYRETSRLVNGTHKFSKKFWFNKDYFDAIKDISIAGQKRGYRDGDEPASIRTLICNNDKDRKWLQISAPSYEVFPKLQIDGKSTLNLIPIKTVRNEKLQKMNAFLEKNYKFMPNDCIKAKVDKYHELLENNDPDLDTVLKTPDSFILNKVTEGYSWKNQYSHDKSLFMAAMSNNTFAIRCGKYNNFNGRLICLDFDSVNHEDYPLSYKQLDYIGRTYFKNGMMWQKTQSHGIHIFAMVDEDSNAFVKNNGNKACFIRVDEDGTTIGCDVRTDNGYVVVSGKGYGNIHYNVPLDILVERFEDVLLPTGEINEVLAHDIKFKSTVASIDKRSDFRYQPRYDRSSGKVINQNKLDEVHEHLMNDGWQTAFRYLYQRNRIYQLIEVPRIDKNQIGELDKTVDQVKKAVNNRHVKTKTDKLVVPSKVFLNHEDVASPQFDIKGIHFNDTYQEGRRNTIIFTLGSWLRLNLWDKNDTLDKLIELNNTGSDPLDPDEIKRTVKSIYSRPETNLYGVNPDTFSMVKTSLSDSNGRELDLVLQEKVFKGKSCYRTVKDRTQRSNSHYDETIHDIQDILVSQEKFNGNRLCFGKWINYQVLTDMLNEHQQLKESTKRGMTGESLTVSAVKKVLNETFSKMNSCIDSDLRLIDAVRTIMVKRGKMKELIKKYPSKEEYQLELEKANTFLAIHKKMAITAKNIHGSTFKDTRTEKLATYLDVEDILFLASVGIETKKGKGIRFNLIDENLFKLAFALMTNKPLDFIEEAVNSLSLSIDIVSKYSLKKVEEDSEVSTDSTTKVRSKIINISDFVANCGRTSIPIVTCPVRTLPIFTGR